MCFMYFILWIKTIINLADYLTDKIPFFFYLTADKINTFQNALLWL